MAMVEMAPMVIMEMAAVEEEEGEAIAISGQLCRLEGSCGPRISFSTAETGVLFFSKPSRSRETRLVL